MWTFGIVLEVLLQNTLHLVTIAALLQCRDHLLSLRVRQFRNQLIEPLKKLAMLHRAPSCRIKAPRMPSDCGRNLRTTQTALLSSVGRLRNLGTRILQNQAITPDQKTDITVQQRFFEKDFGALNSDYAKAIEANSALAATVGSKVKEAGDAAKSFLENEVASLAKGDFSLSEEDYRKHATVARDALYGLFDVSMRQFDNLLVARLNRLETNLYLVFGGTGVALLVVLYLFVGMLLSVLRSLKSIEQGAERLAQGDVSQFVDSHSTDELRRVGGAVNSVVQTLQKFTKAELDMARSHNEHGRISETMRASEFPGAYGDMAQNLNAMVKGHIDVQTRFTELMGEYASGRIRKPHAAAAR